MRFKAVGLEARARLVGGNKADQERQPYREAILSLDGDQTLEIEPEENENLRMIRLRVRRAAREVGRDIQVGETEDGSLLIWLAQSAQSAQPVRRRRRRRRADQEHQGESGR